jgi:hypothetical protein
MTHAGVAPWRRCRPTMGMRPMWNAAEKTIVISVETHDSKGLDMTEALTFTPHRTISSVMVLAVALIIAASMALGFGIRSWTEHTTHTATPAVQTVQPVTSPSVPAGSTTDSQPLLRLTGPR